MLISAGDLISKSIAIYRANWKTLLAWASLFLIPVLFDVGIDNLFAGATGASVLKEGTLLRSNFGQNTSLPFWSTQYFLRAFLKIIISIISIWLSIGLVHAVRSTIQGDPVSKKIVETLHATKRLLLPTIIVSILLVVVVAVGFLLLIVPGIIFIFWYTFSIYEVLFEGKRGMDALKSSKVLVQGRWGAVAGRLCLATLAFAVTTSIAAWIVTFPFSGLVHTSVVAVVLTSLVSILVNIAFLPCMTIASLLLYTELKKTPLAPPARPVSVSDLSP